MSDQSWQSVLQSSIAGSLKSHEITTSDVTANCEVYDIQWMKSLSTRENILYGAPPYMPILIENILEYVKLDDFEFERIKEIQTAGIVFGEDWNKANLLGLNPRNHVSVKLTLECCKRKNLIQNGYCTGMKLPCKLFGRLINLEGEPLLEVHHLIKTDDLEGCLKTIAIVSQIVRQKYHYYTCTSNS